jgi:hypothetical protein
MLQGFLLRPEGAKRIWPGAQRVFERSPRMGVQQVTSPDGAKGIQDVVDGTELSPCLLDPRSPPLAGARSHAAPARFSRRDHPKPRRADGRRKRPGGSRSRRHDPEPEEAADGFVEESIALLERHGVQYDPRYITT